MWGESLHDGLRCPCDNREVGSRSDLRGAPVAFPVLDGIEAESEGLGKPRLGHMQFLPDALDVNRIGNVDLKALAITGEVGFDLVKAVHQFVECAGHGLPPVRVENVIRTLLKQRARGKKESRRPSAHAIVCHWTSFGQGHGMGCWLCMW